MKNVEIYHFICAEVRDVDKTKIRLEINVCYVSLMMETNFSTFVTTAVEDD